MMAAGALVGLPSELISELSEMPDHLVRVVRQVPSDRMTWTPEEWGGSPGETFSALELAALVQVGGDVLGVLSGVLAYVVVDRTTERQQARATKHATWRALLPQT